MAVVVDDEEHEVAHLLAVARYKRAIFPPYLYTHVRIIGEGIYQQEPNEQVFGLMVSALKERLQNYIWNSVTYRKKCLAMKHYAVKTFSLSDG